MIQLILTGKIPYKKRKTMLKKCHQDNYPYSEKQY